MIVEILFLMLTEYSIIYEIMTNNMLLNPKRGLIAIKFGKKVIDLEAKNDWDNILSI